jgi:hypothetical protein
LLAIPGLAIASRGFAQESNGSPDGLYVVPDAGGSASTAQDSASDRSARTYLSSLDSQGEQFQRDLEKADATRNEVASARRMRYLAAGGDPNWSTWRPGLSERTWMAVLACVGLAVSLAAGGYVWWSRTQFYSRANGAVLLALRRELAAKPDGAEQHDTLSDLALHDHARKQHLFTNYLGKYMNILNRLTILSVGDLHQLQTAILEEVHRRRELAGGTQASGEVGPTAAAPKLALDTVQPVPPRKAA